jgi:hypothetical protein
MVLPSADIHRNIDCYCYRIEQQSDTDLGNDRSGLVVNHLILDLLFAFAFVDNVEDQDFTIFMERAGGDFSGGNYVCIKLVSS